MLLAVMVLAVVGGGVPTKRLVSRLWRVDLEAVGSGNAGAGNATRSIGLKAGVLVALIDGFKGLIPILVGRWLGLGEWSLAAIGLLAVAGNNWPIFGRHRGGRGLATSAGVIVGAAPSLILWPAAWSVVGWRIGGGIAGFFGWGLLPFVAAASGASQPRVALTAGLAVAMIVRRAQGNTGFHRKANGSRVLFDDEEHAGLGLAPSLVAWLVVAAVAYFVGGWWAVRDGSMTGVGALGAALLVLAVGFEFGAKWAFGELFREGVTSDGGVGLGRKPAFRAALIGSGVARLIPAGGAVTPVAMAWAVREEARGASGAAVRATMLNYAALLFGTGGATLWVLWRFQQDRYVLTLALLAAGMLAAGAFLAAGAGRLGRLSRWVPFRWRERAQRALSDHSLSSHSVLLMALRVVSESVVLGLCLLAFAVHLAPSQVIAAFGISQLVGGLPGTPGGVGLTEAGLAGVLAFYGVGPVVGPIIAFRLISYWLPAAAGASVGGFNFLRLRGTSGSQLAG